MYTYILVFSDSVGTQYEVKRFLDSRPEIIDWYYCMSNSFFLVSEQTATELTTLFFEFTRQEGRFLILETNTDRNGWLPPEAWTMMNRGRSAARTRSV